MPVNAELIIVEGDLVNVCVCVCECVCVCVCRVKVIQWDRNTQKNCIQSCLVSLNKTATHIGKHSGIDRCRLRSYSALRKNLNPAKMAGNYIHYAETSSYRHRAAKQRIDKWLRI